MIDKRLIIDGHNDTMMHVIDEESWLPVRDIGRLSDLHIDLDKLEKGGLSAPIFAAFTEGYYKNTGKSLSRTLAILNALYFTERKNRERFRIVDRVSSIRESFQEGKIAAIPSIEGGYCIDGDNYYELLEQFKDLGVKILGFNWNYSNHLGEGAGESYEEGGSRSDGGLTDLGIRVLKEMKRLGIGIDVSHMNERTFWGVVENVDNPIIASHSNAYQLTQHRRNLKDDQLRAIRNSGGLVGAVLCPSFLTDGEEAYLDDYLDHIDYMVDLIGIDHVGIGSDFDGASLPVDMKDSSETYRISDKLVERGYREEEIDKILAGNFLRVFEELEKNSDRLDKSKINIKLDIGMGDRISRDQVINIRLSEEGRLRIILDGEEIGLLEAAREVDYILEIKNDEIFHILTVEGESKDGEKSRLTNIIHI